MIRAVCILILTTCINSVYGQSPRAWYDSLHLELKNNPIDSNLVNIWNDLANFHKFKRPDSSIYYSNRALTLSRQIGHTSGELAALRFLSISHEQLNQYSKSLRIALEGLKKSEEVRDLNHNASFLFQIGVYHHNLGNDSLALVYQQRANTGFIGANNQDFTILSESLIARIFTDQQKYDSALLYLRRAYKHAMNLNKQWVYAVVFRDFGRFFEHMNVSDSALYYYRRYYRYSDGDVLTHSHPLLAISRIHLRDDNVDSAVFYAEKAIGLAMPVRLLSDLSDANKLLSEIYEESDPIKALSYQKSALSYSDSISSMARMANFKDFLDYDERQRAYEIEKARIDYRNEVKTEVLSAGFLTLLMIAILLYRNNRIQNKSKRSTEIAYERLKNTQAQLIHSEKMASLGELTAGIAHEIQNPLNFVNNFSDVNKELVAELEEEIEKGDKEEIKAILKDLRENEEKVTHHGKRAEGIVKSMLQHSRGSEGQKELTDINVLADEYLRLAYHGFRAKDQSFNASFKTEFDDSLPKIEVVPQDIGRVLLNLINNAFQAVSTQIDRHSEPSKESHSNEYKPEVVVSTEKSANRIKITISDNGPGIPDNIQDKIFQPFFTTKASGQGTGLGLSMSYDIITKGHNGDLIVKNTQDRGAEFIISLPIKS